MMQNKVISVISKPPERRLEREIRGVLPWLQKKSDLLKNCKHDVLEDVLRSCAYRRAVRDEVIVVQGDKGDCFYIMLTGKTSVYIDTTKSDDDGDPTKMSSGIDTTGMPPPDDLLDKDSNKSKKKKPSDRSQYGKFIIHFEAGKSFGEIALISEDSVRNATVIADEDTDMLLIHRDLFNRSMKAEQEKEYAERKAFIDGCRLFAGWSAKFKHLLEMSIRKQVYRYGTCITRQGEPVQGLYFIISGQAKVMTEPSRHKHQYPVLTTQKSFMEQEFGRHNKENVEKGPPNGLTQPQICIRRKEGYAAAERRVMSKSVDICCVEANEIQGDVEVVMDMNTSAFTVTCTADTTVFILDLKNYDRLVVKRNPHTVTRLKQSVLKKLHSRTKTSNGENITLLKLIHDKLFNELKPKIRRTTKRQETVEQEKQTVLSQMVKLYLQDKVPLIDPLLPDSFHNRIMSAKRNKHIDRKAKKVEEQGAYMRQRRNRVPRSLKQLQNSSAETELLYPGGTWLGVTAPPKEKIVRPRTALGIEKVGESDSNTALRSESAVGGRSSVFHLTECEASEETGETVLKEKSVLITEEFNHMFKQMDTIQREKTDARSKVICTVAAKNELRNDVQRAPSAAPSAFATDMLDMDEDYFDYETSATNLKNLENRIKQFCDHIGERKTGDNRENEIRVSEMKCFQVKGADAVPMSGGTVFVNRKPCAYPRTARLTSSAHHHVRRFMIARQKNQVTGSSSSLGYRPKSAAPSLASRPKSAW